MEEKRVTQITKKSTNFAKWYNNIVLKAELADYSPVKGCMIIRPYGFAIWENIQKKLDQMIKQAGIKNAYFPLFIPENFLKKEKEHVEGFSPELVVATIGGGQKLAENLILRPTSETIIYTMYSKWIKSWRDLPLLINQWCNIVRWEKRTYLFLRTTEFLWQEGHTCHSSHQEALKETQRALDMYTELYRNFLAIDGIMGKKSPSQKFPGALDTYTYEMLMPDGKALQGCTSHDLGQNFSKPFNISFQNKNGKREYVWQTCWGFSTRSIGGLIMAHGDDQGLIFPPKIAPIQVVIVPIWSEKTRKSITNYCQRVENRLKKKKMRVHFDNRREYSPGWKFNLWELKGVPIRLEIGPSDIKASQVTMACRDGIKIPVLLKRLEAETEKHLRLIQQDYLLRKSSDFLRKNTHEVNSYDEFKKIMEDKRGFIRAFWCENPKCEEAIKHETKASTRCLPLDAKKEKDRCIYCGQPSNYQWIFAQAY